MRLYFVCLVYYSNNYTNYKKIAKPKMTPNMIKINNDKISNYAYYPFFVFSNQCEDCHPQKKFQNVIFFFFFNFLSVYPLPSVFVV